MSKHFYAKYLYAKYYSNLFKLFFKFCVLLWHYIISNLVAKQWDLQMYLSYLFTIKKTKIIDKIDQLSTFFTYMFYTVIYRQVKSVAAWVRVAQW